MGNLKVERLKILSRVNQAVGNGDLDAPNRQMDVLLNNIRPALDDGTEEKLDSFLKELKDEYDKGIAAVNEETKSLKPLDMNAVRRQKYYRMKEYRVAELYRFLNKLVQKERLIPMGEEGR